jgi:hypothetical protein
MKGYTTASLVAFVVVGLLSIFISYHYRLQSRSDHAPTNTCKMTSANDDHAAVVTNHNNHKYIYEQDGPEAKEIAEYLPYFPFKGISRFYDIGGFLYNPMIFQKIIDIFVNRYRDMNIDVIAGYVVVV